MPIQLSRAKLTNLSSSPSLPVRKGTNEEEVVQKPSRPKPNEKRSPCPALKTYFSFSLQSPLSPLPPGEPYFFLLSLSPFFCKVFFFALLHSKTDRYFLLLSPGSLLRHQMAMGGGWGFAKVPRGKIQIAAFLSLKPIV